MYFNSTRLTLPEEDSLLFKIKGIATNSRESQEGFAFFAIKGEVYNGRDFVETAVNNGAKFIITQSDNLVNRNFDNVEIFETENIHKTLVKFLEKFYNTRPSNLIAITGTNGKTSTTSFISQIFNLLGIRTATIGTLGVYCDNIQIKNPNLTTPDIVSLYREMYELKTIHNVDNLVMEVSSIGLDQNRIGNLQFNSAVFTNLTHDHLDYHGNMENYMKAKMILFEKHLISEGFALINSTIDTSKIPVQFTTYGKNGDEDFVLVSLCVNYAVIRINKIEYRINLNLLTEFQAINLLAAIAVVLNSKYSFTIEEIIGILSQIEQVAGRMEFVGTARSGAKVFVDFAHTPDGMENVLQSTKNLFKNHKITVVFGCGGNRDKTKRPKMGGIAQKYANFIIVTDDNPRNEIPFKIRAEILESCPDATEIADRREAIHHAIKNSNKNEIILILGKGHENYQIIGDQTLFFSDKEVATEFLQL